MATAPKPRTPRPIPATADEKVIQYFKNAVNLTNFTFNIRSRLLELDQLYYREQDRTTANLDAQAANRSGNANKLQNITMPVVMPQVESALAYLSDTFLSSYPIFGSVAPPSEAESLGAMDTLIGENSIRAGWPMELMKIMRDGLKYDLGIAEVVWEKKKTFNIGTPDGMEGASNGKVAPAIYEGNSIYWRSPYNAILDTRVSPDKNHIQGEFAGYTELISRTETKRRMDDLDPFFTQNFRKAYESANPTGFGTTDVNGGFYIPEVNPRALLPVTDRRELNWLSWMDPDGHGQRNPIKYRDVYEYSVLYVRIIPNEFTITEVSDASSLQIWKFIIINREVVIYAERQTNAHNYLPLIVCKPSNDGMGWQSKSFAENAEPIQQVSSSLLNSALASQRRKVYDRILYDPTKIRKQDIDSTDPVARIPVKSAHMGKGLADAIYQFPYRDDGVAEIMNLSQQIVGMGDILNGQNRVQQGQFQKGNKTRSEFETVMSNSNSRQKMAAIALEYSFYTPIKEIIKSNILQYQPPTTVLNSNSKQPVAVDPEKLRKAMVSFTLSDGLLPSDKLIDSNMFQVLMQSAQAMPELRAQYDFIGMFSYMMTLKGAHWVKDFKRTPEEQQAEMQRMQQAAAAANTQPTPPNPGAPT